MRIAMQIASFPPAFRYSIHTLCKCLYNTSG